MRVTPASVCLRPGLGAHERLHGATMLLALLACVPPAAAQDPFPEGPGKDVTLRMCGTCHPAERSAAVRLTRDGWRDVMARMVTLGAQGSDAERTAVLEYLAASFKGEAPKPVNLNTAPAIDLESVAGLLRKESAALIAYRTKHGPCKALEDLKNVPGVDFRKIDRRRDRLVCI